MKSTILIYIMLLFPITLISQQNAKPLKSGDNAPTFYLKTLEGESFFLRNWCGDLRQPWKQDTKHIILLSFFATWCEPCKDEIPILENIMKKNKDYNFKILLVNLKESTEAINNLKNKMNIQIPILVDKYGVVAKKYYVNHLPKLFIIDQEGKIQYINEGYSEDLQQKLDNKISSLLK